MPDSLPLSCLGPQRPHTLYLYLPPRRPPGPRTPSGPIRDSHSLAGPWDDRPLRNHASGVHEWPHPNPGPPGLAGPPPTPFRRPRPPTPALPPPLRRPLPAPARRTGPLSVSRRPRRSPLPGPAPLDWACSPRAPRVRPPPSFAARRGRRSRVLFASSLLAPVPAPAASRPTLVAGPGNQVRPRGPLRKCPSKWGRKGTGGRVRSEARGGRVLGSGRRRARGRVEWGNQDTPRRGRTGGPGKSTLQGGPAKKHGGRGVGVG